MSATLTRYPIYHIPYQRSVKDLSACFLTYHTISSSFQGMFSSLFCFKACLLHIRVSDTELYHFDKFIRQNNWIIIIGLCTMPHRHCITIEIVINNIHVF
jgi:hypothetical protein